jgi:glycosyltransferase involved in cell wall biosynthesis
MITRLVMLGAAPETRGSIATVVDTYRAHGLFKRWPITYVATHGAGARTQRASLALRGAGEFTSLLAQHRRVALHVHSAAYTSFWRDSAYMCAAFAARCPVILHLHGGDFAGFYDASSPPSRGAIRFFLEHAAHVATPSQRIVSWVRSVTNAAHVTCLPNPVTIPPLAEGERPNLILFLGALSPEKGIFDLLDALSQLRAAIPDVRLVCAGEGDRSAVAAYAERLGIADAVKFTGWIGPSGKRALLESAAAFALPSYSEGLPVSLLEAMAAGVPVVASPVGSIPDVLVDGVSGFLAAPGDVATLTRVLRKLLLNRKLGATVGAAGRETVRARYAPERAIACLEALYEDVGLQSLGDPLRPLNADLRKAA